MTEEYKRMQVKVLYSFNNSSTVFLSRSKQMHSIKTIQIPMTNEEESITLGAFELKSCILQVLKSSPENFKLHSEDYAVYYKDMTEQPDEPFVANGVLSTLLSSSRQLLVPGRVCQNLSASFLFGDKSNVSPFTLEIRLKLHSIEKSTEEKPLVSSSSSSVQSTGTAMQSPIQHPLDHKSGSSVSKRQRIGSSMVSSMASSSSTPASSAAAVKATRTKSLPAFYPHSQQIFNIMTADKANAPSKYDSKSVQDRFKQAPFMQLKILENPRKKYYNRPLPVVQSKNEPQRAMRTRSMVTRTNNNHQMTTISSPINEETDTSDADYHENMVQSDDAVDETNEDINEVETEAETGESPYITTQTPGYKSNEQQQTNLILGTQFQALPDMEDLDSRKTHAIPQYRLPKNHTLVCMNSNCAATHSITWRYFETGYHPNYLSLHRTKEFDIKHYEGMIGPLCNACYLFLRNKGFMRPEAVVKKYMQQQKYKKELREKEETSRMHQTQQQQQQHQYTNSSSPSFPIHTTHSSDGHTFTTPSHTPSAINQLIQTQHLSVNSGGNGSRNTPNYQNYHDINEFINQLNSFGGPLTDIDPIPSEDNRPGVTPPMMATKSNTRIINLYDDGENKENCPPLMDEHNLMDENFEDMIVKSFNVASDRENSPRNGQSAWMNSVFNTEPTPRDLNTPKDSINGQKFANEYANDDTESEEDVKEHIHSRRQYGRENKSNDNQLNLPKMSTFTHKSSPTNMPSSPFISQPDTIVHEAEVNHHVHSSSPTVKAARLNTTMSYRKEDVRSSTPNTDFYSQDDTMTKVSESQTSELHRQVTN